MSDDDTAQTTGQTGQKTTGSRIPAAILQQYPDLEELINSTESMTDEEREYWFQIMPIMTEDQIKKLRNILIHEKKQLAKLDTEYEAELTRLNEKHLLEWKDHETRQKREKLQQEEASQEEAEVEAEAALLGKLEEVDEEAPTDTAA